METLVTIQTFTYAHDAAIARGVLESEGIYCTLKDEFAIQINPFYSNALGGVKLQVKSNDAEDALAILKQYEKPAEETLTEIAPQTFEDGDPIDKDTTTIHCPYCQSIEVGQQRRPSGWAFVLSVFTLGFPLPFFKHQYHCFNCGRDFRVN